MRITLIIQYIGGFLVLGSAFYFLYLKDLILSLILCMISFGMLNACNNLKMIDDNKPLGG